MEVLDSCNENECNSIKKNFLIKDNDEMLMNDKMFLYVFICRLAVIYHFYYS